MTSEVCLTFEDIQTHLQGFNVAKIKTGYFYGDQDHVILLAEASSNYGEGRWLVKYKDGFSYAEPQLFNLLYANCHTFVNGQTLDDGTVMNPEKALELSKTGDLSLPKPATPRRAQSKRKTSTASTVVPGEMLKDNKRRRKSKTEILPSKIDPAEIAVRGGKNYLRPVSHDKYVNTVITDEQRDQKQLDLREVEDVFQAIEVQFYNTDGSTFELDTFI